MVSDERPDAAGDPGAQAAADDPTQPVGAVTGPADEPTQAVEGLGPDQPTQAVGAVGPSAGTTTDPVPVVAPGGPGDPGAPVAGGPGEPDDDGKKRGWLIAVIALVVLLLAGGIGVLIARSGDGGDAVTVGTVPATTTPTTAAPGTTGSTTTSTTAPSTTSSTQATTTSTTAPTTTSTTAPGPQITQISAPSTYACSQAPNAPSSNMLTLSWATTGAVSVDIAIDNPTGVYQRNLPASGNLEVPAPCAPDSNTYYVIAKDAQGNTATRSVSTRGV
jgi:hypothetical protein